MPSQRRANESRQPEFYEIRVRGLLGPTLLEAFPGLAVVRRGGDTLLRGQLPDQCALYGVIHQLDALGLELLELRALGAPTPARAKSHELVTTPHQVPREPPSELTRGRKTRTNKGDRS